MSKPRPAFRGTTYLVTRRCSERRFMLQPSAFTANAFAFVLAVAAQRTAVLVHAVCVMANHYHAVVTDPHGRISEFYHYLHEFTAKVLNAKRGRWENVWATAETSRVSLEDRDAVIDKIGTLFSYPCMGHSRLFRTSTSVRAPKRSEPIRTSTSVRARRHRPTVTQTACLASVVSA